MTDPRRTIDPGQGPQPYTMTDADRDRYLASASASDLAGAITRPSGDESERYRDRGPGHAAGWSGRQQAAAREIEHLWRAAMPIRGLPRSYSNPLSGGRGEISEEEAAAAQDAWRSYCEAMDEVARCCSTRHANALRMVVVYNEPSTLDRAHWVREALAFLADYWRLR